MRRTVHSLGAICAALVAVSLTAEPVQAAIIDSDGGITLWVSYDNLNALGAQLDANVTQVNSTAAASCDPTNTARAAQGAPNSPGSCPGGNTCKGIDKFKADVELLARYIYQATQGAHFLKRVYVSDEGRAWESADVRWNIGGGGSVAPVGGWKTYGDALQLNSSLRKCIHDVVHHEFGHYFYALPDRYAKSANGYYKGRISGGASFNVAVDEGDPNSVMAGNFPHRFVDGTNARLKLSYDQPGPGTTTGEVLTPALLSDADATNDGPDRAHHGFTNPFAEGDWSMITQLHADLVGVHTEGNFNDPNFNNMPAVDLVVIGDNEPMPGIVLLLDRSGSMSVTSHGVPASQFVQEAGLYLYHSSNAGDWVGTFLYNQQVEKLFDYAVYNSANTLNQANFRPAQGMTNIALALEKGIDALVAAHGQGGANGGRIILMSDGVQTTGGSLWDQVDRAAELGIKIDTLTFGNADGPTMEQIASTTSGTTTQMSERADGAELKAVLTKQIATVRGGTSVHTYRGVLNATAQAKEQGIYEGSFNVPPGTKNLRFDLMLDKSNAAGLQIELKHESGQSFNVTGNSLASKGRFNGLTIPQAKTGKWTYRIISKDKRLPSDMAEINVHAVTPTLDGNAWISKVPSKPGRRVVKARLSNWYPLTNMKVVAHILQDGRLLQRVALSDDGRSGDDGLAEDGEYSGSFEIAKINGFNREKPTLRIDVSFEVNAKTIPAPHASYETGSDYKRLVREYQQLARAQFTAWASRTVSASLKDEQAFQIKLIDKGTPLVVRSGQRGIVKVAVEGVRPSKRSLRVNLGPGVKTKVQRITPSRDRLGAIVEIAYEVQKEAAAGTRNAAVQVGSVLLTSPPALNVQSKIGGAAVPVGRPSRSSGTVKQSPSGAVAPKRTPR